MKNLALAFAHFVFASSLAGAASAQTQWDLPTNYASSAFHTKNIVEFAADVEKAIPLAELQAVHATVNAKLRAVGEHTGATILDMHNDICGSGDDCLSFFGIGEPKFSDNVHLRPVFVREHLRFLDPLLK